MDISILEKLDLTTFEKLCRVLFDQMGFIAKSSGSGSMPGIGEVMVLYSKASKAPFALLQCAVAGARIDLLQLAQVKNAMAKLGLANAYLVSVGAIGLGAREFAAANKINLVDGEKFVGLVNNLPETGRELVRETLISGQLPKSAAVSPVNPAPPATSPAKLPRPPGAGGPPDCAKCGSVMKLQVTMKGPYETGKYWQCPQEGCGYISAYL